MSTTTRSPSAAERVYEHVKAGILDGTLTQGLLLTEGDIAEDVGVSRTPVREALLRLEVEGLMALYPKKGALVIPVTADEAKDVVEARSVIEIWAAGKVWPSRHELADALATHLEEMKEARENEDVSAFTLADRTFHEEIVAAAGNAILTKQYRSLRERQLCITATVMRISGPRMRRAVQDHAGLVETLRHGTRAQFVAQTREHLEVARRQAGMAL
ncbi:GntR family transcriptional regulator [Segeticoccus rhizosphaerae]|jgi:DNA-binding GntR family transcriptional regulator|uniref:GntR family transcriptional regulator n=1 Tax=Segeticoccus rhizosphaerae TaxID=1104777 RepID=UPI0010BF68C3|nr:MULTISPECIES: GntR family transcriptional regulator [Intrasporangiaceae]